MTKGFGKPTIDWIARRYSKKCIDELVRLEPNADIRSHEIYRESVSIWREATASLNDDRTKIIYAFCSLVLASYRLVSLNSSQEVGFTVASRALSGTLDFPCKLVFYLWLWKSKYPLESLRKWGLARKLQKAMGSSMGFEEKDSCELTLIVSNCGFQSFFANHNEAALTKIMCSFDRTWMELTNKSIRPIFVSRPSALSTGDESCRFVFSEEKSNEATPIDVVWSDQDVQRAAT